MWKFQRQKDCGYAERSCIGYVESPGSRGGTPYQAECGVLSVVCLCHGLHSLLQDKRKWLHTFVYNNRHSRGHCQYFMNMRINVLTMRHFFFLMFLCLFPTPIVLAQKVTSITYQTGSNPYQRRGNDGKLEWIGKSERKFVFNERGFCDIVDTYSVEDIYSEEGWSGNEYWKTNLWYPYSWQMGKGTEIIGADGNIYTYPTATQFNNGRVAFFVQDKKIYPDAYCSVHGRSFSMALVEMNRIKIGDKTNTLTDCLNGLDWKKVAVLMPNKAFSWEDFSSTVLAYSVIYEDTVPKEVWDNALRIKTAIPDFLPEEYVDRLYGSYQQAVISKIDNSSVRAIYNTTLMGITFPAMKMSNASDNHLYCYQSEDVGNTFKCFINPENPLYCLRYDNLSIKWVFTPQEGERIYTFEEEPNGRYLFLFGSTTKHGYVGFENPMIVIVDNSTGKEHRWYYDTPRKGAFKRVGGISDNVFWLGGDSIVEIIDFELFLSHNNVKQTLGNPSSSNNNTPILRQDIDIVYPSSPLPDIDENEAIPSQLLDEKPSFPGDLTRWISSSINYPSECKEKGIKGRAIVGFIIDSDGFVRNVRILSSAGNNLLDDEAIRIIKSSPKWTPGKTSDGKNAISSHRVPVVFVL